MIKCLEFHDEESKEAVVGYSYHDKYFNEDCKFHYSSMGNQCKTCAVCKAMIFNIEGDMSTSFVHHLDEDYTVTNKGTLPFNVYGRPE